jgi:hypothetical protein
MKGKKMKQIIGNISERVPKIVEGNFKIETIDAETGEIIESYEDKNKVVIWVYEMFSKSVYGYHPSMPKIEDFAITAFALGTNGQEADGSLKPIDNHQLRLYSEEDFWNGNYDEENKAYVYQITFEKPTQTDEHYAVKTDEGATFPQENGRPIAYRGQPWNDEEMIEAGVSIKRSFSNNVIHQEIYVGKFAANGHPMWDTPPKFNEAALYMSPTRTEDGRYLGLMFSMKTFPAMTKTEKCIIKITWDLNFQID